MSTSNRSRRLLRISGELPRHHGRHADRKPSMGCLTLRLATPTRVTRRDGRYMIDYAVSDGIAGRCCRETWGSG